MKTSPRPRMHTTAYFRIAGSASRQTMQQTTRRTKLRYPHVAQPSSKSSSTCLAVNAHAVDTMSLWLALTSTTCLTKTTRWRILSPRQQPATVNKGICCWPKLESAPCSALTATVLATLESGSLFLSDIDAQFYRHVSEPTIIRLDTLNRLAQRIASGEL